MSKLEEANKVFGRTGKPEDPTNFLYPSFLIRTSGSMRRKP